jgi:cyclopropane fatty-acyl-phospholipid synthase-like methyltransferase
MRSTLPDKAPSLLVDVADYYTRKLVEHGETPRGVDWNSEDGQQLRFAQLLKLLDGAEGFSLLDLGCGYGALVEALQARFAHFDYLGLDVSAEMVEAARRRFASAGHLRFEVGTRVSAPLDFAVASGIFNVRMQRTPHEWRDYVNDTLDALHAMSLRGFAFNCLTSYSDADRQRDDLHYADPCELFHRCKTRYGRNVALLHDYGLYEFTIIVRKP